MDKETNDDAHPRHPEQDEQIPDHKLLKELSIRFEKQQRRWNNYSQLCGFFFMVSLLLLVLWMQRGARVGFEVHTTVKMNIVDSFQYKSFNSPTEILTWLENLADEHWTDPPCGDGRCELPFEFPSYSRFGCRADCSLLSLVALDVNPLQIDLYFDFLHSVDSAVVSLAPTALLDLASWNVCPVDAPHGASCIFAADQKFTSLKGHVSEVIDAVPPGNYSVVVKRDYFNKVSGAVRDQIKLAQQVREHVRIGLALRAASAGWDFEVAQLQLAKQAAQASLESRVLTLLDTEYRRRRMAIIRSRSDTALFPTEADYNATLDALNTTYTQLQANILQHRHSPACQAALSPINIPALGSIPEENAWDASLSGAAGPLVPVVWINSTVSPSEDLNCTAAADGQDCECVRLAAFFTEAEVATFEYVTYTIVQRLDPKRTNAMTVNATLQMESIRARNPEQIPFIGSQSTGLDYNNRTTLKLTDLIRFYFNGPLIFGPQGGVNEADERLMYQPVTSLPTSTVLERLQTRNALVERINARLEEVEMVKSTVDQLPEIEQMRAVASTWQIEYNLAAWAGGKEAYETCNIAARAPEYSGTCTPALPFTVTAASTAAPYTCGASNATATAAAAAASGAALTGTECAAAVDRQLDCDALCVCTTVMPNSMDVVTGCVPPISAAGSVAGALYCHCSACEDVPPVTADPAYDVVTGLNATSSRRLQQSIEEEQLGELKVSVERLEATQAQLQETVAGFTASVQQVNADAQERAADHTLPALIERNRLQLAADEARTQQLLATIIGNQNQALELVELSQKSIAAIRELSEGTAATLANIESEFATTFTAIKTAITSSVIGTADAVALWKAARRRRLVSERNAELVNLPCTYAEPGAAGGAEAEALPGMLRVSHRVEHRFEAGGTLQGDVQRQPNAVRERVIGGFNRIIGGILIHSIRRDASICDTTRFPEIQNFCFGDYVSEPFGVDPVFKPATGSFNPDMSELDMLQAYNCTEDFGSDAIFNIDHPTLPGQTANPAPYCAQHFNKLQQPWGFKSLPIPGHRTGYPVWLDVNLSHSEMRRWISLLNDGLFFDPATVAVTAEVVTYNAHTNLFAKATMLFQSDSGGAFHTFSNVNILKVEIYKGWRGAVQLTAELLLTAVAALLATHQLHLMLQAQRHEGSPLAFHAGGLDTLALLSTALLCTTLAIWWTFARRAADFRVAPRYNVYEDMTADVFPMKLAGGGAGMVAAARAFERVDEEVVLLAWYYALNGVHVLVLVVRLLHLMHFQPRLGVVTRSLVVAMPDLFNFLLVGGVVFMGYAMMGHLIFGTVITQFKSFPDAITTCLEIIMGDPSINAELRRLPGLMNTVGQLYFWSFELVVFMVLMNFLLAIIVDAFCEVKEATVSSASVLEELRELVKVRTADALAYARTPVAWLRGKPPPVTTAEAGRVLRQLAYAAEEAYRGNTEDGPGAPVDTGHTPVDTRVLQLGLVKLSMYDVAEVLKDRFREAREAQGGGARKKGMWAVMRGGLVGKGILGLDEEEMEREVERMAYWVFERFSQENSLKEEPYKFEDAG
eukprot:jgi/Ulvmu1/11416/UM075_0078.1